MRKRLYLLAMTIIAVSSLLALTPIVEAGRIGDWLIDKCSGELSSGPATYRFTIYLWSSIMGGYYATHHGKLSVSATHQGSLLVGIRKPDALLEKLTITSNNIEWCHDYRMPSGVGAHGFRIFYWTYGGGELDIFFRTTKSGYDTWEFILELDGILMKQPTLGRHI